MTIRALLYLARVLAVDGGVVMPLVLAIEDIFDDKDFILRRNPRSEIVLPVALRISVPTVVLDLFDATKRRSLYQTVASFSPAT